MKYIYTIAKHGNTSFRANDLTNMQADFSNVYGALIRGFMTNLDEDLLEGYVAETYLFLCRMLMYFEENAMRENVERAKLGRVLLVAQAKNTFSDLLIEAFDDEIDMFDPLAGIKVNERLNTFEYYCFNINVMYVENFPAVLREKQRLNRMFLNSIEPSIKAGENIHNKLLDYLTSR